MIDIEKAEDDFENKILSECDTFPFLLKLSLPFQELLAKEIKAPGWEGPFFIDKVGHHDSYRLKTTEGVPERHPVNAVNLAPFLVAAPGT